MELIETLRQFCPRIKISRKQIFKAMYTINREIRVLEQAGVYEGRLVEIRQELPSLIAIAIYEHQKYCKKQICQKCKSNCGILLRGHYCKSLANHIRRIWRDEMVRLFNARRVSVDGRQIRAYTVVTSASDYDISVSGDGQKRAVKIIDDDV